MIIRRLTEDIDGISGIMPLATEPDSDWEINKESYIAALNEWINAGCPDLFGNVASTTDFIPQLKGFQVTATGSTVPFPRSENYSIQVPSSTASIDLWFALSDESSNPLAVDSLFSLILEMITVIPSAMPCKRMDQPTISTILETYQAISIRLPFLVPIKSSWRMLLSLLKFERAMA